MIRYLGLLVVSVSCVMCSLDVGESQEVAKTPKPVSKIGQFSLRNDGKDLMKPIGSDILLPLPPKAKEEVIEVERAEKKEIPEEELRPKIPKAVPEPKEVKKEEVVKEEGRMGLKFAEGEEELPKAIAKPKVLPKPEVEPLMPERSQYFSQLAPGEKLLPPEIKEVKKPKVTPPKLPPKEEVVVVVEEGRVAKVEEMKEIIPPEPAKAKELVRKEPEFAFQRINPVLRWGIILSGLFTLILILLVRYLWRQKEVSSLAKIGEIPADRPVQYKSLVEDVKELQTGYKSLEKMIENVEKRLVPLSSLKDVPIDEFARETSKEVVKPIESGIKQLQATCQGLERMFGEFDKRLAPLDALKGLSIKELAHQTSMEFYRPLENEFKKMQVSNERMMAEFEDKIDKKIDSINKKGKGLEKTIGEIDSRLITIDSMVSSLPRTEGIVPKPLIKTEEVKPITPKDKRGREILHNQIYKLSDEGLSIDEIAQRTKLGKGEVRLILGLRKK
ncbi:MAG: hypothetical protein AB1567_02920 [bacterium]